MKNVKTTFQIILITITFLGCEKGDTGPQGPAGTNGNANVQSSTVTISSSEWTLSGNEYDATISTSLITQAILDHGAVEVFESSNGTQWLALPISINGNEFVYSYLL